MSTLWYTSVLSLIAMVGAACLIPLVNLFFHPELWLDLVLIGLIVTAVVAPPLCLWTSIRIVMMHRQRVDLAQQKKQLRAANEAAAEASAAKDRFVAVMSHEIRTPLSGVLGLAQMLADRPQTAENKELAQTLLDNGNSLMALLNDLLDLSRVEAGKMNITPVEASLAAELSKVEMLFRQNAFEKGLSLDVRIDPNVPEHLVFDPVRLRQCVGNLLSNAIKFTARGGITVDVRMPDADRLEIAVTDTGIGMSKQAFGRVFQAFSQASPDITANHGGTGLGLAICRHLSEQMGGEITVSSEPGRGATFTLTIATSIVHGDQATRPYTPSADEWLRGANVLIVDDVPTNRLVQRAMLLDAGAQVRLAQGGPEALAQVLEKTPDIVLMDLSMPGMDGYETARALRVIDRDQTVPIIAVSAHITDADWDRCREAGMDGALTKPLNMSDFLSELARIQSERRKLDCTTAA